MKMSLVCLKRGKNVLSFGNLLTESAILGKKGWLSFSRQLTLDYLIFNGYMRYTEYRTHYSVIIFNSVNLRQNFTYLDENLLTIRYFPR